MTPGSSTSGGIPLANAVRELYALGQTDYSLEPVVLVDSLGKPVGCIEDGDAVVFCCRRGEREVQLTEAFVDRELDHFPRQDFQDLTFVILTLYHEKFRNIPVAFAPTRLKNTLGETVGRAGLRQIRLAESEKFAHVTFFLDGGCNQTFAGEEVVCVPSLKGMPLEKVPELSLAQVSAQVERGIDQQYDLIVANFANGDVIGHQPNIEAKIKCAEHLDKRLGQVLMAARAAGYVVSVTADHGNLEQAINPDGTMHIAHTFNPVPFIVVAPRSTPLHINPGTLADIAPTVLQALGVAQPEDMQGRSLVSNVDWGGKRRVLLLILDGWGIGKNDETNPIFLASTPVWDDLIRRHPYSQLQASGEAVGLKPDKVGNSEAGHINIGAGRLVLQDDVRLDLAMQDGSFYSNDILCRVIQAVKQRKTSLHLIGLLTEKSSHGSIDYPLALLRMAKAVDLERVFLHIIFDGRSTQPGSAPAMLENLEGKMQEIGVGQIASGVGRGIALDRDGNYARTKLAYDLLVYGVGKKCIVD